MKDWYSSCQVRQNLGLFRSLVAPILGTNCAQNLIVKKTVKKNKFEGEWGKLEGKNYFQKQSWAKYMRQILVFR